jgi:hypothetical protein
VREQQRVAKPTALSEDAFEALDEAGRAAYLAAAAAYKRWVKSEQDRTAAQAADAKTRAVRDFELGSDNR